MRAHTTWFVIYLSVQSHSGKSSAGRRQSLSWQSSSQLGSLCLNSAVVVSTSSQSTSQRSLLRYAVCTKVRSTSLSTADDACSRQSGDNSRGLAGSGDYQKEPTVDHNCVHDCQPWSSTNAKANNPARPRGHWRVPVRGF